GNRWESTIAHELFHHWFGDYVTAESWSNITVNESFADYSEFLWAEHAHGADEAAFHQYQAAQGYLSNPTESAKDLVRFHYEDKEEVFDLVSYQKGGRILHMLRQYLGDPAFFAGLNRYLTENRLGTGSAHKLRMAFEAVSGKDLNWFFNQWYFGNGHPKLNISYGYDADKKMATVFVKQNQGDKIFTLPAEIDVYTGNAKKRYTVWLRNKADSFYFPAATAPDLVNFDPERTLLAEKSSNKTKEQYFFQFNQAKHYLDRREAIDYAGKSLGEPASLALVMKALEDPFFRIRLRALITLQNAKLDPSQLAKIKAMAQQDPAALVRGQAVTLLGKTKDASLAPVFVAATKDSSYSVAGAGLEAWLAIDPKGAFARYQAIKDQPAKGPLSLAITKVLIAEGNENDFEAVLKNFADMPLSLDKINAMENLGKFLAKVKDETKFKKGVDQMVATLEEIPAGFRGQFSGPFNNNVLKPLAAAKEAQGQQNLADYAKSKMMK
ncbi:MAG: M1 family peptidase, partial [Sphingobacteriia bacterium]